MKFLDRQYGRPYQPPRGGSPKGKRWGQPEDVIGTVSGREKWERYNWADKWIVRWDGYLAGRAGKPLSDNPHGVHLPHYRDWRSGWLDHSAGRQLT